jgi:hypothetical protein
MEQKPFGFRHNRYQTNLKGDTAMLKKRVPYLVCALLLAVTLLTSQFINVAYADGNRHSAKHIDKKHHQAALDQYLKPQLNVKVKNGEATFTHNLVNKSGRKNTPVFEDLSYTIQVYSYGRNEPVWSSGKIKVASKIANLKPGLVKPFPRMNHFNNNKETWNLLTKKGDVANPGKYRAEVIWQAKVDGDLLTTSVSKNFMVQGKHVQGLRPRHVEPEAKYDLYVDLDTRIQDGRLNIDISLINKLGKAVTLDFSTSKRYDIKIRNSSGNIVYDTRDKMYLQVINSITVDANSKYKFETNTWDFTDKDGKKVEAGKYTISVEINPMNYSELNKKYKLNLEEVNTVDVSEKDVKYDIDAILKAKVEDKALVFNFEIRNRTTEDVILQFRSGQDYRLTISDSFGKEIYRSDDSLDFTMALRDVVLKANTVKQFDPLVIKLSDLKLKAGQYKVNLDFNVRKIMDKDGKSLDTRLYNMTDSKTVYYNNHSSIKIE